jgi:hypothetical protein
LESRPVDFCSPSEAWFFVSEIEGERASSFRQARWCQVFLDAGVKVRVFNQRGPFNFSETVCATRADFEAFRQQAKATARPAASVREGFLARLLRRFKHLLMVDLYYPSVFRLVARADRILASHAGHIVLLGSSPPFSMALAGANVKRRHAERITFVVDMRDAWALHLSLGGIGPLKRGIERRALRTADYVTTVSHGLKDEFESTYGISVTPLYNVATHYFELPAAHNTLDWSALNPAISQSSFKFVYTGSTPEGFYALKEIVGGVRKFRQGSPFLAERIQLIFVGACEEVAREVHRQGDIGTSIVFIPHVPHRLAQEIQQAADALVFLAYDGPGNKGVVSTKLFEYFGLGKAVFPLTVHTDSDVHRLLLRYCGASLNLLTIDDIADALTNTAVNGITSLPRVSDRQRLRELLDEYRHFVSRAVGSVTA